MKEKDIDFKKVIRERFAWEKKIIKIKFYSILIGVILLLVFTFLLYFIVYWDLTNILGYNLENTWLFYLKPYLYWVIFFNNILLPLSIIYLYFLVIDNIDVIFYSWEKQKAFNDDESYNF